MIRAVNSLYQALATDKEVVKRILSNIDSYYYEVKFEKYKSNGKLKLNKEGTPRYRIINPSINELKLLQKRIDKLLGEKIPSTLYAHGATKGKDNVLNARFHLGNKYVFQTDLQDFFPFVTNSATYQMFRHYGFSPDVSSILTKLTTYKGHLPQGAPTSATIANLVFSKTGDMLAEFCKSNGFRFTTFVDDVTISAPFDFKDKVPEILEIIKNGGFKISHIKTTYKTNNPIITGVKKGNNYLDVTDKFKEKLAVTEGKSEAQILGELNYRNKVYKANKRPSKLKRQTTT